MNRLVNYMPIILQNLLISIYNSYQYRIRQGGKYKEYREYFRKNSNLDKKSLDAEVNTRLRYFLNNATSKSEWYSRYCNFESLNDFPVLNKSDLINNLNRIATIEGKNAVVSFTGGTTGASMKVLYTKANIQERQALLDNFKAEYGYELGKKCAWFSGKNIVTESNLRKGICFRDDFINKIRFFSTFHITEKNFEVYWTSFCQFAPEYMIGFPSSVYEICAMAKARGLKFERTVKAFFPTAETLLPIHREVIGSVLGCRIADQYASSEGAPFILECRKGGLHMNLLSGVFEVVDEKMAPALEGELLVTAFTTEGTPLIRYRVGDKVKLAEGKSCSCGSNYPLVEKIEGRTTDYILSPTHGKVNLGNISNSTKGVKGIVKFQVIQRVMHQVEVSVVVTDEFTEKQKNIFFKALKDRFGSEIVIILDVVDDIPKEKSGKFRFVKNLLGK